MADSAKLAHQSVAREPPSPRPINLDRGGLRQLSAARWATKHRPPHPRKMV